MNVSKSRNKMASHQVPRFLPYFGITGIQCLSCRCTSFVDLPATVVSEVFPLIYKIPALSYFLFKTYIKKCL